MDKTRLTNSQIFVPCPEYFALNHLKRDRTEFPQAVDRDIAAIHQRCNSSKCSALIFTNRLARRGKVLVIDAGSATTLSWHVPNYDNSIAVANPLALPDSLDAALRFVAQRFFPSDHTFTLVAKSHDSIVYALPPGWSFKQIK